MGKMEQQLKHTTTKTLDIVLPCYNPLPHWAKNVVAKVHAIQAQLPNFTIQLIVVNDGSSKHVSDKSIQYIQTEIEHFNYITYTLNKGKGYALRQGMAASKSQYCIFTDIDFPYQQVSFFKILKTLREGADLAIGVRSAKYYESVPKVRIWISKFLKILVRLFLKTPVDDTQGGLKGFSKAGKMLFLQSTINRYLFDLEFIYQAGKQKTLDIRTVEVDLREGIVFTNMNWKVLLGEGWSFLKLLFRG